MIRPRVVFAMVLAVVVASVGIGAATPSLTAGAVETPTATPTNATQQEPQPLGETISTMMQASAAQTAGTVENGMWAAAYANASNASERQALVEQRYGELNSTLSSLKADRRALQTAFRNGTINRTTYLGRLSRIVGQLAALGEGIEDAGERGESVGVNQSRLEVLRSQARNLSGAEVSRLARNLTDTGEPPGRAGLFEDGGPGRSDTRGQGNASESQGNATRGNGQGQGQSEQAGNGTRGGSGNDGQAGQSGNTTRGGSGDEGQSGGSGEGNSSGQSDSSDNDGSKGEGQSDGSGTDTSGGSGNDGSEGSGSSGNDGNSGEGGGDGNEGQSGR